MEAEAVLNRLTEIRVSSVEGDTTARWFEELEETVDAKKMNRGALSIYMCESVSHIIRVISSNLDLSSF